MKKLCAWLVVAALAFIVLEPKVVRAATDATLDLVNSIYPQWFQSGIYIGSSAKNPASTTANKITTVLGGHIDWNFASKSITCEESAPVTVPGAVAGDPCFVGYDNAVTGTAGHDNFSCRAYDGGVYVKHCAVGTVSDPGDAGFDFRVISGR